MRGFESAADFRGGLKVRGGLKYTKRTFVLADLFGGLLRGGGSADPPRTCRGPEADPAESGGVRRTNRWIRGGSTEVHQKKFSADSSGLRLRSAADPPDSAGLRRGSAADSSPPLFVPIFVLSSFQPLL